MKKRRRGIALVIALFFQMMLFAIVLAFFKLIPLELTSARTDHVRYQAYYMNNSMLQAVWAWLRYMENTNTNPLTGLNSTATGDPNWPQKFPLTSTNVPGLVCAILNPDGTTNTDWSADVSLYPDVSTLAGNSPHVFKLRVVSRSSGLPVSACEYLLLQQTFAQYGFFVDKLPSAGYYTANPTDVYEGEFHVNGKMPLMVSSSLFTNFISPVFRGKLSFSQADTTNPYDSINYQSGSAKPFDANGNTITDADGTDRYSKMFSLGRSAIKLGNDIGIPATNPATERPQAKAAWFGRNSLADTLANANIPAGVNLNTLSDGTLAGIYIKGNVRDMQLDSVDGLGISVPRNLQGLLSSGNPMVKVREESTAKLGLALYTRIIEVRDPNLLLSVPVNTMVSQLGAAPVLSLLPLTVSTGKTVIIRDPGTTQNPGLLPTYTVLNGYPNGVIYVDGNIGKVPALDTERAGGASVNRDNLVDSTALLDPNASTGGLFGTNYGTRRTIAVNIANNNYVRIANDIYRGDTNPGSAPSGYRDGLGIVAYDTVIGGEIPRAGDVNPLYLYSLMITGRRDVSGVTQPGSVIYENWSSISGWGRLASYGSYVVGNDRTWGDNGSHGWMPAFRHDAALASNPPPYYPTRSDFQLQSFQNIPVTTP